ncbi:hypothetical protein [Hymenobacter sp. DG01]|uniref:alginate O-acetyltransferase AlgX-related protein n=1 Tax=Hymenobacter sp. DG01 TaxID=2584940 RepID=UPI001123F276|nr:hypothetical protein [Hymenobacter sp. DG01]
MAAPVSLLAKRLFFAFFMALLALPALQSKFHFVKFTELTGYAERAPHPDLSWEGLRDNSYQPALEHYLEDRAGFREPLIRLRNQLAFSLFNVGRANNTVVGEKGILFDGNALDINLGSEFMGEAEVGRHVYKFKAVQEALAKRGTLLVFVIAPGKATFYSEYWPSYYQARKARRTPSNYSTLAPRMKAAGINLLDFNQLFLAWKDTAKYPLFSRGGIHWSVYGSMLAADTLFRYIEHRSHIRMPQHRFTGREISDQPRETDNDLTKVLNLIWEPTEFTLAYPKLEFEPPKPAERKPNLLLVGDSFVWNLIPFVPGAFSEKTRFWYYNNAVDWAGEANTGEERQVSALDRPAQLTGRDVVVVLFSEPNLGNFDHGFSDNAFGFLCPFTDADRARINVHVEKLRGDKELQQRIWEQAYKDHQNPDYMLYNEAVKRYEQELGK